MCIQRRARSVYAFVQANLDNLYSSAYTTRYIGSVSRQWRPISDCAAAKAALVHLCPHMFQIHIFAWRGSIMLNINPCPAAYIKMSRPIQIFSQSNCLIQIVDINSHTEWQTVYIQISWLLKSQLIRIYAVCKGRVYPGSAGQGLTNWKLSE